MPRIPVIDRHPFCWGALMQALGTALDTAEIAEAAHFDELQQRIGVNKRVDLILPDHSIVAENGLSSLLARIASALETA